MGSRISRIENDVQDRNSHAWKLLCEYIDRIEDEKTDEFAPAEALGAEMFSQIYTLPETISKLKNVKKIWLYGSRLKRIPPEIGDMLSLEYFDPYTSYDLHWFPFEITKCKNLKDSRVSTRALYGNYKNRMLFPSLENNPVRYYEDAVKCSMCGKTISYSETNQLWITLRVATDDLPLLGNFCSKECEGKLPNPPQNYFQSAHKGGLDIKHPKLDEINIIKNSQHVESLDKPKSTITVDQQKPLLLKVIKKIWDR
jgi:hypothetical protein